MPSRKTTTNKKKTSAFNVSSWSRMKKTVATVVVFGLIGGGWLVYKSFAANIVAVYDANNYAATTGSGFATATKLTDTSGKSPFYIWHMPNRSAVHAYNAQVTSVVGPNTYQYCYVVRGAGTISPGGFPAIAVNSTTYVNYCTVPRIVPGGSIALGIPILSNYGGTTLDFKNSTVQLVTTVQTTAPAK